MNLLIGLLAALCCCALLVSSAEFPGKGDKLSVGNTKLLNIKFLQCVMAMLQSEIIQALKT